MADAPLPAQIDYLIKELRNPSADVWVRQSFRDRLTPIAVAIGNAVREFDAEFKRASAMTSRKSKASKKGAK